MMRERMRCTVCSTCAGLATATKQDDDRKLILRQLLVENAQLKEEVYFMHSSFLRIYILSI